MKKIVRRITEKIVYKFISDIELQYTKASPIDQELCDKVNSYTLNSEERLLEINKIRTNNIITTVWTNTGAVFTIVLTLSVLLLFVFGLPLIRLNIPAFFYVLIVVLALYVIYKIMISLLPYLIRRIVLHLPPQEYADISLNNLNDSDILTFTAIKMWELCQDFVVTLELPRILNDLIEIEEHITYKGAYIREKSRIIEGINKLSEESDIYSAKYNKSLNNVIALMKLASLKLKIQERELCNHIFKFSPYIFRKRVDTLKASTSTLKYIIESEAFEKDDALFVFKNTLKEVYRVRQDVIDAGMRSLEQIILYDKIHSCLIGMASIVSTSRSLNIFCRGISEALYTRREGGEKHTNSSNVDVSIEKFKSILHRSKAHYGMDLLVLLENFYKQSFPEHDKRYYLPDAIYKIKYPKRLQKRTLSQKFDEMTDAEIVDLCQTELYNMRNDILMNYRAAIRDIKDRFWNHLEELRLSNSPDTRIVFCLFGYSRIVRNVLKLLSKEIKQHNVITFVVKEDTEEMIDTQIFRFELNDEKPEANIRKTFTASDEFFESLINPDDKVVFIAGIEAYDESTCKLLHTNNYQKRVTRLIESIDEKTNGGINIWLVGGKYKIFKEFPDKDSLFGNEFFSDHYDKIDLYDFKKYEKCLEVIQNY